MSSLRRSSRRHRSNKDGQGPIAQWRNLGHTWRRQYVDLGHCRLSKCTKRLYDASEADRQELRSLDLSFVAKAISAAACYSGASRVPKELELIEYINGAMMYDFNANDNFNGDSAVELAAYHGFSNALNLLLDAGCPLKKDACRRNAVFAAVKNGQHATLEIILSKRTAEARRVLKEEALSFVRTGFHCSSLIEAISKYDVVSVQLLHSNDCVTMSDVDAMILFNDKRFKRHKKLERVLLNIYPDEPNVMNWRGKWHWSFPTTDRETMNWLWYCIHNKKCTCMLPDDVWLRVFSFFGRGWFASRYYDELGSPGADLLQRNILE